MLFFPTWPRDFNIFLVCSTILCWYWHIWPFKLDYPKLGAGEKSCDLKRLGERVSLVRMWQKFPRREETPRETIGDFWGIGWEQGRRVQVTVNTFKEKWKTSDIRILETIWLNLNYISLQEAHNDTASDIKDPKIMKRSSTVQK